MKRLILSLAMLSLSGCMLGPDYQRRKAPVPGEFRGTPATPVSIASTKWQDLFADAALNQMVTTALANNFDVKIAAERAEEARLQLGITRATLYPFVDASAGFTASKSSTIGASALIPAGTQLKSAYSSVGMALSWEIDLWGKLRRLNEAARAKYLASEEVRHGVTVSLVSNVMETYFQLLEQDLELEISRRTLGTANDSLKRVSLRHDRGAASGLDVRQAEQLIFTAGAQSAAAERAIAQSENLLSLLQGSAPAAQTRGRKLEELVLPAQLPAGSPADLMERRPDIREAEQQLIAANAQIGAARALCYPQLTLNAFAGAQSRPITQLFSDPASVLSIAPSLLQPIFRAGQTQTVVRLSEAQQRELLLSYQKTIYGALREVADAVVSIDRLREQRMQEEKLVQTLEGTVKLSDLRYKGGLDSYLQVLDAERNLFNGQLALARLRLQERIAVVQLYRALGGGWS